MTDAQSLPVFAFVDEAQQAEELKTYFESLGAKNLYTTASEEHANNVLGLIKSCSIVGEKLESSTEVEMLLNSLCSLIVALPEDKATEAVELFCATLSGPAFGGKGWQSKAGAATRVLSNLFHGFTGKDCHYSIYCALVQLTGRAGLINELPTDLPTVRKWFEQWNLNMAQKRQLLRLLHEALSSNGLAEASSKTMIDLLGTYTTQSDAESAVSDARECVRSAVVDPSVFVFDHLLRLRPVQLLQTSDNLMFRALQVFVSGNLSDFVALTQQNPTFVSETLKCEHAMLVNKMRICTLMSMTETKQEISFQELSQMLDLTEGEQLEEFIITAVLSGAIQAKIDQVRARLIVTGAKSRRFEKPQWEQLKVRLDAWAANLRQTQQHLKTLQMEN